MWLGHEFSIQFQFRGTSPCSLGCFSVFLYVCFFVYIHLFVCDCFCRNIEELLTYTNMPQHKHLPYATKQLIAREIDMEKMRKAENAMRTPYECVSLLSDISWSVIYLFMLSVNQVKKVFPVSCFFFFRKIAKLNLRKSFFFA